MGKNEHTCQCTHVQNHAYGGFPIGGYDWVPNQGDPSSNPMGSQFSILALWNLCSESIRAYNFDALREDSSTDDPSLIAVWRECLFLFQFCCVNLFCYVKKWWGGAWKQGHEGDVKCCSSRHVIYVTWLLVYLHPIISK